MWLITTFGFFSIVKKNSDHGRNTFTIRARVRKDLEQLREFYLPNLGQITSEGGTDYPFRAKASRRDIANAFARAIEDISYANFKHEAGQKQGHDREIVYNLVEAALHRLQSAQPAESALTEHATPPAD